MQFTTVAIIQQQKKAVYYGAKILILMQFTTDLVTVGNDGGLFIMVQRY